MTVSNLRNLPDVYNHDYEIRPVTVIEGFYSYIFSFIGTNME